MSRSIEQLRARARDAFARHGVPTRRLEHWKYTDVKRAVAPLADDLLALRSDPAPADALGDELSIAGLDAWRIVIADGEVLSLPADLPQGVHVQSLAGLLHAQPEQGAEALHFDEQAPLFNGFVALNAALACDGVVIRLEDGVHLDRPLYLLHLSCGKAVHIRHRIQLGRHAEATVIEHYTGMDAGLSNGVSRLQLAEGASLHHLRVQQEAVGRTHIGRVEAELGRHSRFVSHSVALGASLSRVDIVAELREPGADCRLDGLYLTDGRQHADHHTVIAHRAPHCRSREMYRGVLDGRSRAVFNGRVVVHEGAVKTDSAQSNANLLLSGRAEVDTKPELEIYNDDVKCAHGATIGQLDENQLFYLKSRGLAHEEARQLLTFAFADEVLTGIAVPALRRHIEHAAFSKLPHGEDIEGMLAGHDSAGEMA